MVYRQVIGRHRCRPMGDGQMDDRQTDTRCPTGVKQTPAYVDQHRVRPEQWEDSVLYERDTV